MGSQVWSQALFVPKAFLAGIVTLFVPLIVAEAAPSGALEQRLSEATLHCVTPALRFSAADQQALRAFYSAANFQPVWTRDKLRELFEQLQQLADDGLEPLAYQLEPLRELSAVERPSESLAICVDVLASTAYLQALHDLRLGRLEQARVEPLWRAEDHPPVSTDHQASLRALALTGLEHPDLAFEHARPEFAPYRALRRRYAELRRQPLPVWLAIPGGTLLRPGAVDGRVPLLGERLRVASALAQGDAPADGDAGPVYGPSLVAAVKRFQRAHLLNPDGVVGGATLAELNRSAAERMDQMRINLERMRWLSAEIAPTGVLIDIAGAEVQFLRNAVPVWQARTQVGRPSRATPLLRSEITHLTLNPTWTIPPTILREDKLPELRRDAAGYLAANRMRVIDYQGNAVEAQSVDWEHPGRILVRQDAGPQSALGRVALRFPNPFSVYLHDTPSQRLFDRLPRVFSSGCVRIERVEELVEQLLAEATPAQRARIAKQWQSGQTRRVDLPRPVPILMAYWTAQVSPDGRLQFRPDIYAQDARLLKALNRSNQIGAAGGAQRLGD
jgi:murein L,D-transpeptidase YcbB/YkuD